MIKIGYQENERLPENFAADVDWINANRLSLYEKYGSCVVLVYHEEIIGRGSDLEEALSDAEERLKDESAVITPVIKYLSNPYSVIGLVTYSPCLKTGASAVNAECRAFQQGLLSTETV